MVGSTTARVEAVGDVDGSLAKTGQVSFNATVRADLGDTGTPTGWETRDGLSVDQSSESEKEKAELHDRWNQSAYDQSKKNGDSNYNYVYAAKFLRRLCRFRTATEVSFHMQWIRVTTYE